MSTDPTTRTGKSVALSTKPGKPVCKYGAACYRKNSKHFEDFDHPTIQASKQQREEVAKSASSSQMFLFRHTPPTNIRLDPTIPFVIGRSSDSTLHLPFGDVSRKHAIVKFNEADSTWVVTDSSSNGISINGNAVPSKTSVVITESSVLSLQVSTQKDGNTKHTTHALCISVNARSLRVCLVFFCRHAS